MGTFRTAIGLAAGADGPFEEIAAPADTGATCTLAPAPLPGAVTLDEFGLGVDPVARELVPVVAHLAGFRRPEGR